MNWRKKVEDSLEVSKSDTKEQPPNEPLESEIRHKSQPGSLASDLNTQSMINKKVETLKNCIFDRLGQRRAAVVDSTAANKSQTSDGDEQAETVEKTDSHTHQFSKPKHKRKISPIRFTAKKGPTHQPDRCDSKAYKEAVRSRERDGCDSVSRRVSTTNRISRWGCALSKKHSYAANSQSNRELLTKKIDVTDSSRGNYVNKSRKSEVKHLTTNSQSSPSSDMKNLNDTSTKKAEKRSFDIDCEQGIKRQKVSSCSSESSITLLNPLLSQCELTGTDIKSTCSLGQSYEAENRHPGSCSVPSSPSMPLKPKTYPTLVIEKELAGETLKPHFSPNEKPGNSPVLEAPKSDNQQLKSCSDSTSTRSRLANTTKSTTPVLDSKSSSILTEKVSSNLPSDHASAQMNFSVPPNSPKNSKKPPCSDAPCNQQSYSKDTGASEPSHQACDILISDSQEDINMEDMVVVSDINEPSPVKRSPQRLHAAQINTADKVSCLLYCINLLPF